MRAVALAEKGRGKRGRSDRESAAALRTLLRAPGIERRPSPRPRVFRRGHRCIMAALRSGPLARERIRLRGLNLEMFRPAREALSVRRLSYPLAVQQPFLHIPHPHEFLVPAPALELVDSRWFERLSGRQPTCRLLVAALLKPLRQTLGTTERIRLEFADDTVRPPRRNLVNRQIRAALGVAIDGVGRHRHGGK